MSCCRGVARVPVLASLSCRLCAWRMRVCTMSTSQVHYRQHSTTTKGWRSAPDAILSGHPRAPQWIPARTPTVHWGPNNGEAVGGPHQRPKGRSAHAMTRTQDSPTHKSSDRHGSGAGDHQLQVTITNRRRRLSRYRRTSSSIRYR